MEREIKFRAWHKEEDKMYLNLQTGFNSHAIGGQYLEECFTDSDLEIMQYTGLKDKNGKEIYDGDIVMLRQKSIMKNCRIAWYRSNNFRIVEWKESRAYCGYNIGNSPEKYEVIGNIHEEKNRKGEELKNDRGDDSGKYEGDSNGEEL